jgi:hypothetical protein
MVRGDKFEVIEDGQGAITDGQGHGGKVYYLLSAGERFDLKARAKLWSGLKTQAGTWPILLTSEPPPPGINLSGCK